MRILQVEPSGATVELTRNELLTLNQALNEICDGPDAIEPWEFHARMGVKRDEATALLAEFGSVLA